MYTYAYLHLCAYIYIYMHKDKHREVRLTKKTAFMRNFEELPKRTHKKVYKKGQLFGEINQRKTSCVAGCDRRDLPWNPLTQ